MVKINKELNTALWRRGQIIGHTGRSQQITALEYPCVLISCFSANKYTRFVSDAVEGDTYLLPEYMNNSNRAK